MYADASNTYDVQDVLDVLCTRCHQLGCTPERIAEILDITSSAAEMMLETLIATGDAIKGSDGRYFPWGRE